MGALNMTVAVIVTYNRSAKLMKVLDAIQAQTQRPDIVLVVDNASTDDTGALVKARAAGDDTIRHLRLPENVGGAGASTPA
ncbi:glycosyltransferase [Paracoccus aerius]